MNQFIQFFEIAKLIFVAEDENRKDVVTEQEIEEIRRRFDEILNSFIFPDLHYTKSSKTDNSNLPYNSGTKLSFYASLGDYLILNFISSYHEPLLFVYNIKQHEVYNFIRMNVARNILDDDIYEAIFENLHQKRTMNHMLKGIGNFNLFLEQYKNEIQKHLNPKAVTGMDCFKIVL